MSKHQYKIGLSWTGKKVITSTQKLRYERLYELYFDNKPTLIGSADATFHGDDNLYNPEEMLLSALSACYMMSFFYLCGKHKIDIVSYEDTPIGTVTLNPNGSGQFEEVMLQPKVKIIHSTDFKKVEQIIIDTVEYCFIARSCNFTIKHKPHITV